MRNLSEFTAVEDPAWPDPAEMIAGSLVDVQVQPADLAVCAATLLQLQVTAGFPWCGRAML